MRDNNSAVSLILSGPDAKAHFKLIDLRYRAVVEEQMSQFGPVEWRPLPGKKVSTIKIARASTPSDRTTWPELNEWMAGALERMDTLFRPIVKTLDPADLPPEEGGAPHEDDGPLGVAMTTDDGLGADDI